MHTTLYKELEAKLLKTKKKQRFRRLGVKAMVVIMVPNVWVCMAQERQADIHQSWNIALVSDSRPHQRA
eukprot:6194600-Pleurochrysis_carterae.AAC.2